LKNESGLLVHLGEGDYESRLIRLLSILEDLKKKNQEPLSVDLRFRYVPVVLKEVEQNKSA
jgi:cell division septal protein FtsQ